MKIEQAVLLNQLQKITRYHLEVTRDLRGLPEQVLNFKPSEDSWSVLECIEHLVRYGNFYIPEIQKRIRNGSHQAVRIFKSGLPGNYFAEMMVPKPGMKKMKTFKNMNPSGSSPDITVIDTFAGQLNELLRILEAASSIDLNRTKTSISISRWVKLRLGDTLRVVIYHNDRHIVQALDVLKTSKAAAAAFE